MLQAGDGRWYISFFYCCISHSLANIPMRAETFFRGCFAVNKDSRNLPSFTEYADNCKDKCQSVNSGIIVVGGLWCGCSDYGKFGVMDGQCAFACEAFNPECHCNSEFPDELSFEERARYLSQQVAKNFQKSSKYFTKCFTTVNAKAHRKVNSVYKDVCTFTPVYVRKNLEAKRLKDRGCRGKGTSGKILQDQTAKEAAIECHNHCKFHHRRYSAYLTGVFCGCVKLQDASYRSIDEITGACQEATLCFDARQGVCLCSNQLAENDKKKYTAIPRIVPDMSTCFNRKVVIKPTAVAGGHTVVLNWPSGNKCWYLCSSHGLYKYAVYYGGKNCKCVQAVMATEHPINSCSSACYGAEKYCGSAFSAVVYNTKRKYMKTISKVKELSKMYGKATKLNIKPKPKSDKLWQIETKKDILSLPSRKKLVLVNKKKLSRQKIPAIVSIPSIHKSKALRKQRVILPNGKKAIVMNKSAQKRKKAVLITKSGKVRHIPHKLAKQVAKGKIHSVKRKRILLKQPRVAKKPKVIVMVNKKPQSKHKKVAPKRKKLTPTRSDTWDLNKAFAQMMKKLQLATTTGDIRPSKFVVINDGKNIYVITDTTTTTPITKRGGRYLLNSSSSTPSSKAHKQISINNSGIFIVRGGKDNKKAAIEESSECSKDSLSNFLCISLTVLFVFLGIALIIICILCCVRVPIPEGSGDEANIGENYLATYYLYGTDGSYLGESNSIYTVYNTLRCYICGQPVNNNADTTVANQQANNIDDGRHKFYFPNLGDETIIDDLNDNETFYTANAGTQTSKSQLYTKEADVDEAFTDEKAKNLQSGNAFNFDRLGQERQILSDGLGQTPQSLSDGLGQNLSNGFGQKPHFLSNEQTEASSLQSSIPLDDPEALYWSKLKQFSRDARKQDRHERELFFDLPGVDTPTSEESIFFKKLNNKNNNKNIFRS